MFSNQSYRRLFVIFLCILAATLQAGCTSKSDHFGIIFTSESSGPMDIYRIPDNTQNKVEQLTFTPTIGEYRLFVSKNGDKIIFEAGSTSLSEEPSEALTEERQHIYLLNTTTKKLVDITNVLEDRYAMVSRDFSMDWSPDQKQFAIITYDGEGSEIASFLELMDFDGKNKKDILIPGAGDIPSLINSVKWSPDGKKFVLTRGVIGVEQQSKNPGSAILIYDLESENLLQITDYRDHCFPQEWSPTSQQIVATCSYVPPFGAEGTPGLQTVRIFNVENPGQPFEQPTFSPCYDPSWSPDGKQMVFVCDKGVDQRGLFIKNFNSSGIYEVNLEGLENHAFLKEPMWAPNGAQIVYVAGSDAAHTYIYSVNPDGSNNHSLNSMESSYSITAVYPLH
jgi:Tol biopolymer transport system component